MTQWSLRGSYFESCNCDAICPCRRIDGHAGGRSTHGVCMGLLSWVVAEGDAAGVDLGGLAVALACRYDDDEQGSPWSFVLYLDERGDEELHAELLRVEDVSPFEYEYRGVCGYGADFDYSSEEG